MPFGAEASAKLGVNTDSVAGDLNKAKGVFQKFGQDVESQGAGHGSAYGDKLLGGLEHRILGTRHLAGALATALGLNIDKLAEGVTAALVGGTKEAWKQMGDLAEENAKLIEQRMELAMDPKHLQDRIKHNAATAAGNLAGAVDKAQENEAKRAAVDTASFNGLTIPGASKLAEMLGFLNSEAEDGVEIEKKKKDSLEADIRLAEQDKAIKESHKKLEEHRLELSRKNLNYTDTMKGINEDINRILGEIASGKLSAIEIDQKRAQLLDLQAKEQETINNHTQVQIDQQNELAKLQVSYTDAVRKREQDEQELANKKADRGKQTIDEIAGMKGAKLEIRGPEGPVDTFGLSEEAANAKREAVEIQRQQKEAERLRRSGDVTGANQLFEQISARKQSLVDSGFAKSTEGDDFKKMAEQIHKDNEAIGKILADIATTAKGKLKNQ